MKPARHPSRDHQAPATERGAALIIAMLLVVVIGSLTASLSDSSSRAAREATLGRGRSEALAAAEGAVETARVRLMQDPAWAGGELTIGRSTVLVSVVRDGEGQTTVTATAECPLRGAGLPVRSTVEARLSPRTGLPAVVGWRER